MLASEVVRVSIERPYSDVYDFLMEPLNFARWAANEGSQMEPLDGGAWLVELATGPMAIRFSPRNEFGILDYEVFPLGQSHGVVVPVRLIANGDGAELLLLWLQRPGVSDERFRSDVEWVASDLQRLKSLLEVG